jgi:uncharacterized protein
MTVEICPRCSNTVGAPLRSGRQVCMKCGWSNQPKQKSSQPSAGVRDFAPTAATGIQEDGSNRKLFSILCHASMFAGSVIPFASIIVPICCWAGSKDRVVRSNAKDVLSLQINVIVYLIVCLVLAALIFPVGLLLGILVVIGGNLVLPFLAIIHCANDPDEPYRYPFISHLF